MEHRGIFDSGCSGHMTGNRAHLEDYQQLSKEGSVTFGGSKSSISGKGLDLQEDNAGAEKINTAGEVNAASIEVNTASKVNTGSIELNTVIEEDSTAGDNKGQREGK
ncbi:hypothetical protein Tco_0961046, partial [Tanacetum coccineum]